MFLLTSNRHLRPSKNSPRRARLLTSLVAVGGAASVALTATLPAHAMPVVQPEPMASSPAGMVLPSNAPSELRAAVQGLAKSGLPGGIVHVTLDGKNWDLATGVADLTTSRPAAVNDHVRIGSVTKPFAAVTVLQLVGEGKLSLDDPVERWLPGVVRGPNIDGRKITVRMLLNHSSGLPEYLQDPAIFGSYFADRHPWRVWTPAELVRRALRQKPFFAPGTDAGYSNTNYVLAGMIVKKVTGHSVQDEVNRRIIRPLHLSDTSFPITRTSLPRPYLSGYLKNFYYPFENVTKFSPSWADAAGAIVSTPRDVNKFQRSVFNGRLLRPQELGELTTVIHPKGHPEVGNGLGFGQETRCGTRLWTKDGEFPGYLTEALTTPDGKSSLAYSVNSDSYALKNPKAVAAITKLKNTVFCDTES